jgi:hypothetical protein
MTLRFPVAVLAGWSLVAALPALAGSPWFEIRVVDDRTGRGVPLVELETVNHLVHVTDSAGRIAFNEPGLMGRPVFFHIRSHGYEFPKDGFGYAGRKLDVQPGGSVTLKLERMNIAERLYRVTGEGIYRDTVLLGIKPPLAEPVLDAQVLGQDSVQAAVYRGKIYWFWGDTQRARYPLGHFQTSGATSQLPAEGGLDPSVGVNLDYFTDAEGFSKRMVPLREEGPVWLDGLLTVPDETGRERLVAHYSRMKDLGHRLEHGLVVFNDERAEFERLVVFDLANEWRRPRGQAVRSLDGYIEFATPFAMTRVKASLADVKDPQAYEALTPLGPTASFYGANTPLAHDKQHQLAYWWRRGADPLTQKEERLLVEGGKIKSTAARMQVRDVDSGKPVTLHTGSVNWNAFRKQWVMIAVEQGGTSYLGEVWYAEAPAPTGPWRQAKKILTHNRYTFYNPRQHPFFDEASGRFLYFEGTYTQEFSGNPVATPRYNYNQIMYRLDLADPRLRLPEEPDR